MPTFKPTQAVQPRQAQQGQAPQSSPPPFFSQASRPSMTPLPPPSLSPFYWSPKPPKVSSPNSVLLRPRRSVRRGSDLLLDMPIAARLALGFLVATLIAAVASGIIGFQRSQSLTRQSDFYQRLLQTNTALTTGESFLQLMNVEAQTVLEDATAATPSHETLANDEAALQGLTTRYNNILVVYLSQQLIDQHPDELAILTEANHAELADQQRVLASSTLRTWQFYNAALTLVLKEVTAGDVQNAQYTERYQGEPTNADAQSALRSLVQLNARLANSIQQAANVEVRDQIFTTIIAGLIACLCIILVGLVISNTFVRRLSMLQRVSQQVERGHLESRAMVMGRDEIAEVSISMNAMLDTIVGLLEETQHQRDTLTNAAQQLFSYMQGMNAGELRSSASENDDPIALLSDAFNFTIGRFRRFVLRTQMHVEQLEAVSRQGMEYADSFMRALRSYASHLPTGSSSSRIVSGPLGTENTQQASEHIEQIHERITSLSRDTISQHAVSILEQTDRTALALVRLHQRVSASHLTTRQAAGQNQEREWEAVEAAMQQLVEGIRAMQSETIRGLTDIDHMTLDMLETLQSHDRQGQQGGQFYTHELIRLSTAFLQDIIAQQRQINVIAQEMRLSTTTFRVNEEDAR